MRPRALERLVARAATLKWNRRLFGILLEELYVEDTFVSLFGEPKRIPEHQYAAAVAVALLIRHSWRPDDLSGIARQLGLTTTAKVEPRPGRAAKRARGARSQR